jgi:hypothetical protein
VVNDRDAAADGARILLVAKGDGTRRAGPGYAMVELPSVRGVVLIRYLVLDAAALPAVEAAQAAARCEVAE